MAEEAQSSNDNKKDKKQRGQKGLPRLPLKKTTELVNAVYELGYGDPVPRSYALDHIGRKPGGASDTLVGAATAYGLLRARDGKLELSENGKQLGNPDVSASERTRAALEALYSDENFSSFMARHEGKGLVPQDRTALLFFQTQGLSESDAKSFWEVMKTNLEDFGLIQQTATGNNLLLTRSAVEPKQEVKKEPELKKEDETVDTSLNRDDIVLERIPVPPMNPSLAINGSTPSGIAPEFHFNIQIHLPNDAEPEKYDAIFRSIATHLLGRNDKGE